MAGTHPLTGATGLWEDVIDDLEATAAEYAEDGWETVVVHPGDVTPLPTKTAVLNEADVDRLGFDVLLPGDEFEAVAETVENTTFGEYDAYRGESGSLVFAVVVMKSDDDTAVCFPIYYDADDAGIMLKRAAEQAELRTYLRPLDDSERVVFVHAAPERLFPAEFDPDAVDERQLLAAASDDDLLVGGDDLSQSADEGSSEDSSESSTDSESSDE